MNSRVVSTAIAMKINLFVIDMAIMGVDIVMIQYGVDTD